MIINPLWGYHNTFKRFWVLLMNRCFRGVEENSPKDNYYKFNKELNNTEKEKEKGKC